VFQILLSPLDAQIALLILCYNRPQYLERTFQSLRKYIPADNFPIVISQVMMPRKATNPWLFG
jgi:hypothetical protein